MVANPSDPNLHPIVVLCIGTIDNRSVFRADPVWLKPTWDRTCIPACKLSNARFEIHILVAAVETQSFATFQDRHGRAPVRSISSYRNDCKIIKLIIGQPADAEVGIVEDCWTCKEGITFARIGSNSSINDFITCLGIPYWSPLYLYCCISWPSRDLFGRFRAGGNSLDPWGVVTVAYISSKVVISSVCNHKAERVAQLNESWACLLKPSQGIGSAVVGC